MSTISRFVIEARDHAGIDLKFLASASVPWHARSPKNLQRLMPSFNVSLLTHILRERGLRRIHMHFCIPKTNQRHLL
jgi:hypothetical protein